MTSAALVSVYARPEALYVTAHNQTIAGLWIGSGNVERLDGADEHLGDAVLRQLATSEIGVHHPRQDEWASFRKLALDPLIELSGRRSWTAFLSGARLVSVSLDGRAMTVVPNRRDARRRDVFHERLAHQVVLADPSSEEIGAAVAAAIAVPDEPEP